jgi:hypothetical protein
MSSEAGTSLEELENGDVSNSADEQRMQSILADMNASGAEVATGVNMPARQSMPPMQPIASKQMSMQMPSLMYNPNPPMANHYIPIQEEAPATKRSVLKKKNVWSSIVDSIRDPIVVTLIVFLISLPALHTFAGKYAGWAYVLGGQLSWLGLIVKACLGGLLFALYRTVVNLIG